MRHHVRRAESIDAALVEFECFAVIDSAQIHHGFTGNSRRQVRTGNQKATF